MNKIGCWQRSVPLLALFLTAVGGVEVTAAPMDRTILANMSLGAETTLSAPQEKLQLAQGFVGACRAASRPTFIYAERSTSNPIRALQAEERVTLAEENGRGGWMAISAPITGFVQTDNLKFCDNRGVRNPDSPPPTGNRCRLVVYEEVEGLAVRERPDKNSARVGGVFLDQRVTLSNPPQFKVDEEGREWAKLASPVVGWVSNGFPRSGSINLRACL